MLDAKQTFSADALRIPGGCPDPSLRTDVLSNTLYYIMSACSSAVIKEPYFQAHHLKTQEQNLDSAHTITQSR